MSDPRSDLEEQPSEEFFLRVNDFIAMANRIEKRFDTAHAQVAMLHAMSRYAAHHYRSTVKQDSEQERMDFCGYLANKFGNLTLHNIQQLAGEHGEAKGEAAPE